MAEKKERYCWAQLQKRNSDVTHEEFLACFNLVSETKDSKGSPISHRFVWMANGFDTILLTARQRIHSRRRRMEQQTYQEAQETAATAHRASPEDVKLAKEAIRALLNSGPLRTFDSPQKPQPEHARRAFLLAQAKQIQQIEKFESVVACHSIDMQRS